MVFRTSATDLPVSVGIFSPLRVGRVGLAGDSVARFCGLSFSINFVLILIFMLIVAFSL